MSFYRTIIILCVLACTALAGCLGWVLAQQWLAPPPFHYSATMYAPERGDVCPGETLKWTPELHVRRAPTLLIVARTVWDVEGRRTLYPEKEPSFFVWTELEDGKAIARPTEATVPDLPPGAYEIRTAATGFNSEPATYRVPFVIKPGCGTNSGAPLKGD